MRSTGRRPAPSRRPASAAKARRARPRLTCFSRAGSPRVVSLYGTEQRSGGVAAEGRSRCRRSPQSSPDRIRAVAGKTRSKATSAPRTCRRRRPRPRRTPPVGDRAQDRAQDPEQGGAHHRAQQLRQRPLPAAGLAKRILRRRGTEEGRCRVRFVPIEGKPDCLPADRLRRDGAPASAGGPPSHPSQLERHLTRRRTSSPGNWSQHLSADVRTAGEATLHRKARRTRPVPRTYPQGRQCASSRCEYLRSRVCLQRLREAL